MGDCAGGVVKGQLYPYDECELDNVFLLNGYSVKGSAGVETVIVQDVEGLHRAITDAVIDAPIPLNGKTFRFLRRRLAISQRQLADALDLAEHTVSLWERERLQLPRYSDIALRALAHERLRGHVPFWAICRKLSQTNGRRDAGDFSLVMHRNEQGWTSLVNGAGDAAG